MIKSPTARAQTKLCRLCIRAFSRWCAARRRMARTWRHRRALVQSSNAYANHRVHSPWSFRIDRKESVASRTWLPPANYSWSRSTSLALDADRGARSQANDIKHCCSAAGSRRGREAPREIVPLFRPALLASKSARTAQYHRKFRAPMLWRERCRIAEFVPAPRGTTRYITGCAHHCNRVP